MKLTFEQARERAQALMPDDSYVVSIAEAQDGQSVLVIRVPSPVSPTMALIAMPGSPAEALKQAREFAATYPAMVRTIEALIMRSTH